MARKDRAIYATWKRIRNRCNNERTPDFQFYGARGIRLSEEWNDFEVFEKDMLSTYQAGLSIDRIDVNGPYCKENCRWATMKEQSNNRRSNVLLKLGGKTQNILAWAKEMGVKADTLYKRKQKLGWSDVDILTKPIR